MSDNPRFDGKWWLDYDVVVHAQGAHDAVLYSQPFVTRAAALACFEKEEKAGRDPILYRVKRDDGLRVHEPVKPIDHTVHIGNR